MATMKLRAFSISNDLLTESKSNAYSLLLSTLTSSNNTADRCMILNAQDPNKEEDLISYYQNIEEKKFVFCTMLRMAPGKEVQHVTETLLSKKLFTIDDLDSQDIDTAAIYKNHYYFALNDNYIVTTLPLTTTITRLQTYINWFIKNLKEPLEASPVIKKEEASSLSKINSIIVKDPIKNNTPSENNKSTNLPSVGKSFVSLSGYVWETVKNALLDSSKLDEVTLSQMISAELIIKFSKPRKMSEEEYAKALSAYLKPVSDLDNISFKTAAGNTIKKGTDVVMIKPVNIDTTESGKINEQTLLQEMGKFLNEIENEKDNN